MKEKNILLSRISNYLILNSSCMKNLGLFNGKMGVVLFFMHYARFSKNDYYHDFASILLDEIFEDISSVISIHFGDGLTGIGWGIEYLVQNELVEGNTLEILEDIDLRLYEYNLERIVDKSLETGIVGIYSYLSYHLYNKKSFNCDYIEYYKYFLSKCESFNGFDFHSFIQKMDLDVKSDISKWRSGLNGCSGYGLKLMLL